MNCFASNSIGDGETGFKTKDGSVELHAGGDVADDKIRRELLEFHDVSFLRGGRGLHNWRRDAHRGCVFATPPSAILEKGTHSRVASFSAALLEKMQQAGSREVPERE